MRKIKVALPSKPDNASFSADTPFGFSATPGDSAGAPKEIDFSETINTLVFRRLLAVLTVQSAVFALQFLWEALHRKEFAGSLGMSLTVLILTVGLRVFLGATNLPHRWAHPLAAFTAGLILLNSVLHLSINGHPSFFLPLVLVAASAGLFLLSLPWLGLVLGATLASWGFLLFLQGAPFSSPWLAFGPGLIVAILVSYYTHRQQLFNLQRHQWMEIEEDNQRKTVSEAFQKAQEAEEKLMRLSSASFDAILVHQKSHLIEANPNAATMFGYEADEILRLKLLDLLDAESHSLVSDAMLLGCFKPIEATGRRKDGSKIALEIFSKSVPSNNGTVTVTAFRDITDRKSAHQALLAEQQRLEHQYRRQSALAELDWTVDQPAQLFPLLDRIAATVTSLLPAPGGACLLLWESVDKRFLVAATTVKGQIARSLVPPECAQENSAIDWVFKNRESLIISDVGEDALKIKELFVNQEIGAWAACPLASENAVVGLFFVLDPRPRAFKPEDQDFLTTLAGRAATAITKVNLYEKLRKASQLFEQQSAAFHQKNVELNKAKDDTEAALTVLEHQSQELQAKNIELARAIQSADTANRAKSDFLANISHELRTPMNGILGMTTMLQSSELTAEQQDYVETLNTSAESLLTVINDVLDFARIDSGEISLQASDFSLTSFANDILLSSAQNAREKGLDLCCWIPEDLDLTVRGDSAHIGQVLQHFLSNAIKFTQRGDVLLNISRESENHREIVVRFAVQDTGIGIAPGVLPQLFNGLGQADGSNSRKFSGTGLGLAIASHLVELMHGHIGADSVPGQGSNFWFTVHLEKREPASVPPPTYDPAILAGKSLLIVDDSPACRLTLQQAASAAQMVVHTAATGEEAFNLLRRESVSGHFFSAALIDQHLTGMDGITLARTLRADPQLRGLRLILLVPADQPLDSHTAQGLNLSACLNKPVFSASVGKCLASVLSA